MPQAKFREDTDFMPAIHAATRRGAPLATHALLLVIGLFFFFFIGWASQATLEEVTRGEGKVIPSSQVQIVQNLEGGILSEILVREGQIVDKGQVLLRIENTQAGSDYRETRAKHLRLSATVARLRAEINGTKVKFPADVMSNAPNVAANELELFEARKSGRKADLSILRQQETQRRQELIEVRGKLVRLKRSHKLIVEELNITQPLVDTGVVSRVVFLRLEREANDIRGALEETRLIIPRAQSALQEAKQRINEQTIKFRTESLGEINERAAELAVISEAITARQDRVFRTNVRSSVRGTIKQIMINTVGGVIRPGQDLVEVVPLEDTLLIEAQIRPADIAFLRPDQEAMVKISAYDFAIYGGLKAKVEHISADTIIDETKKNESFYLVRLRTDKSYLGRDDKQLPIIAGMTASVDILTGEKTVLDYLLKPILRAQSRALRER